MLQQNEIIQSPGGSFSYKILGPVCILFDREELPWPSCSLQWRGKQPSWRRIGKRLVPDITASRCGAYSVKGWDLWGNEWQQILILYDHRLSRQEKHWWYFKGKPGEAPPNHVEI
jgi:hypothetical protein